MSETDGAIIGMMIGIIFLFGLFAGIFAMESNGDDAINGDVLDEKWHKQQWRLE